MHTGATISNRRERPPLANPRALSDFRPDAARRCVRPGATMTNRGCPCQRHFESLSTAWERTPSGPTLDLGLGTLDFSFAPCREATPDISQPRCGWTRPNKIPSSCKDAGIRGHRHLPVQTAIDDDGFPPALFGLSQWRGAGEGRPCPRLSILSLFIRPLELSADFATGDDSPSPKGEGRGEGEQVPAMFNQRPSALVPGIKARISYPGTSLSHSSLGRGDAFPQI